MQHLDKNEKEMSAEEKLKLELMRTILSGKGFTLRDETLDFNFKTSSTVSRIANFIMKRFNVSFKNEKEAKAYWPEKDLAWAGKEAETEKVPVKEAPDVNVKTEDPDVSKEPEQGSPKEGADKTEDTKEGKKWKKKA